MKAAEARLQAAASNIVNAQTTGTTSTVYKPVDVVQVDLSSGGQPGGVGYSYVARPNGFSMVSDPESPSADADGMVAAPDVDLATEMVNIILAKNLFAMSAKLVSVGDQMQRTTIDTLA
jgi:flagellar basal-body rod protein FlgC